jgi:hypothetical protein
MEGMQRMVDIENDYKMLVGESWREDKRKL